MLVMCSSSWSEDKPVIWLGSGSQSGAYYPFAEKIKNILGDAGLEIMNVTTSGSYDNLKQIAQNKLDAAIVQNDIAYYTFEGKRGYNQFSGFGVALPLFSEYLQIIVRKDSEIRTLSGLRGRRINLGSKASGGYLNARDVLDAISLQSDTDYEALNMSTKEALSKLMKGEVDVVMYTGASVPKSDLAKDGNIRLLSLPPDIISKLKTKHSYYSSDQIETMHGNNITTVSLTAYLVLRNGVDEKKVFTLMNGLIDGWDKLSSVGRYNLLSLDQMKLALLRSPVPFHSSVKKVLIRKKFIESDTWLSISVAISVIIVAVIWWLFVRRRAYYDRLGSTHEVSGFWSYRIGVFLRYVFILVVVAVVSSVVLFAIISSVQYFEAEHARQHALADPFASLSSYQTAIWMWGWMAGREGGIYPASDFGQILVAFPPAVGFMALVISIILSWMRHADRKMDAKQGASIYPVKHHVLICGWNEKVPGIIYNLTSRDAPERKKVVVIAEIDEDTPLAKYPFPRRLVKYYRGDSADYRVLKAAYAECADTAIIVAGFKKREARNIGSVLTTLALSSLRKQGCGESRLFVGAELLYAENRELFEDCDIDALICSNVIVERLLAQACINKYAVGCYLDLITHDSHCELYAKSVSELLDVRVFSVFWQNITHNRYRLAFSIFFHGIWGYLKTFMGKQISKLKGLVSFKAAHSEQSTDCNKLKIGELRAELIAHGITPVATKNGSERSAFVGQRFNSDEYSLCINENEGMELHPDDIVLYISEEKDDIYSAVWSDSIRQASAEHEVLSIQQKKEDDLNIVLVGDVNRCRIVASQLDATGLSVTWNIVTDCNLSNERSDKSRTKYVESLCSREILTGCFDDVPTTIIILPKNTEEMQSGNIHKESLREFDSRTLMIIRLLRKEFPKENGSPCIIAEMMGRTNHRLFENAGADVVIPSNIIVERMLSKLAFGYGHVNDFLIATLAYDDDVFLDSYCLSFDDSPCHGKTFTQLLDCMPNGWQLFGVYPLDEVIREKLMNNVGDFDHHFLASPAHADRFNYLSQVGDVLMVLRPKVKSK